MNGLEKIKILRGADRVRKRPAVIFGDEEIMGCETAFYGLFKNSVEEAEDGFGDVITVTVSEDGTIEIEDHGRGIYMGWNEEENCPNWEIVFCKLYAGGKFNGDPFGGMDVTCAQYASEFTEVWTYDGKNEYYLHFSKGEVDSELRVTPLDVPRTGTVVRWKPDGEVFTNTAIPYDYFSQSLWREAYNHPGVRFALDYKGTASEYFFPAED